MKVYLTGAEVEAVVRGFETCETDKTNFRHPEHLTVAVYYLERFNFAKAVDRMRAALFRFVDHHGVPRAKYHETITVFWLYLVADVIRKLPAHSTLVERCNSVLGALSDSGLTKEYYSAELLSSELAREEFVEPDLREL